MENGTKELATTGTINDWLAGDKFKQIIANALPQYVTPENFIRVALTAVMRTPKLAECSQASLLKAMIDVGSLGLVPDGRLCHLIPFKNNKTNQTEVQLIVDYKGLIALAKRSESILNIRAEVVCEKDTFIWENGNVIHKVNFLEPRGDMKAVYSHVVNKNGFNDFEVMTLNQIERVRERSKAKDSGPWDTDFGEMAKKTVIRRHSKRLDISPEFTAALEKDADRFEDIVEVREVKPEVAMPKLKITELAPEEAPVRVVEGEIEIDQEATADLGNVAIAPVKNTNGGKAWKIGLPTGDFLYTDKEEFIETIRGGREVKAHGVFRWTSKDGKNIVTAVEPA